MGDRWEGRGRDGERGAMWFGVLLIVLGALFLAGEQLNIDWERYGWPVFVIVPGVVLLVLGLAIPNEAGLGFAIPGGIVTTVGLLLLYQNTYEAWGTWAYAWALIPGSVGVTFFLYGLLHRKFDLVDSGLRLAGIGLGLFIGFGLFFENVIGIGGTSSTDVLRKALPFLAIALGAIIVLLGVLPRGRSEKGATQSDTWHQEGPSA
jgi:hypothetical protein